MNNIYTLENKLDIIIPIFYKRNIGIEKMASCPYCKPVTYDFNYIMHTNNTKELFFDCAVSLKCSKCYKSFIYIKFYSMRNKIKNSKELAHILYCKHIDIEGSNKYDDITIIDYSLSNEIFDQLKQMYDDKDKITRYLPTIVLKRTYFDAKDIINNNDKVSKESKIMLIRPLIEAFLNERNKVDENNDVRKAIKEYNNKELSSSLHKIVDDTLKGVHIKVNSLKNDPVYILQVLETLFTKLYIIPEEEKKLKIEIKEKKSKINNLLKQQLKNIKK